MPNEQGKIIQRRFFSRFLESGLLVLAVALGVGAASSGLSLLMYTREYGKNMLSLPAYREIIISTHDNAEDMQTPVMEKPVQENTVLTASDLEAAELVPSIAYAYVSNESRLHFINLNMLNMSAPAPDDEYSNPPQDNEFEERRAAMEENIKTAQEDPSIIFPDFEDLKGHEVTTQFFDAWEAETAYGSLFTDSDLTGTEHLVVLGWDTAQLLLDEGDDPESLLGKKLLSVDQLYTIVGILEPSGQAYDGEYFSPYIDAAARAGSTGGFRLRGMDTQLRFAVTDPGDLDSAADQLQEWFSTRFGENQIVISNPRAEAERLITRNTGISVLILFLSLAGLFIAAVNVSNILMSRALRMKKNVGILKALGASRQKILGLFTSEALTITAGGAVLGIFTAIPLSNAMQNALELRNTSWGYILIGVGLSWVLTMIFSVIPAWQTSKIEAAQAIKGEA